METVELLLSKHRKRWLVTGAAGFIGSHLVDFLLNHGQEVVGLDNFFNGTRKNLESISSSLLPAQQNNFHFVEGDIRDSQTCRHLTENIDIVLHQAAVGSVPRSIAHPEITFDTNVRGFFEILNASRLNQVKKFVFASSSSVYGDLKLDVRREEQIGQALSPYGWSKQTNENLAANFRKVYQSPILCLRYFNVFGPRQSPSGPYAAVIPRWIINSLNEKKSEVFGDGLQARDFCYVKNVVQANIKAALADFDIAQPWIFNVAYGQQSSLLQLKEMIDTNLIKAQIKSQDLEFKPERIGDIRNSLASIELAKQYLQYEPAYNIRQGLQETVAWYVMNKKIFNQTV